MNLSNIKLVATDMDGTLLNSKGELSETFFPIFEKMKSQNILFAAASGRQLFSLETVFKPIQKEMIFVAENGSYVTYKGEELLVQALDRNVVQAAIAQAKQIPDTFIILCGKKMAYIDTYDPKFVGQLEKHYRKFEIIEDFTELPDDDFLKITLCDLAGSESNSYLFFKDFHESVAVKVSGPIWLDISHKLANKGNALRLLQEKFGISIDETMVFGDYLNDTEMMQQAYYSYGMENGHPDIIAMARFTAKSNDKDGVLEVLETLVERKAVANS